MSSKGPPKSSSRILSISMLSDAGLLLMELLIVLLWLLLVLAKLSRASSVATPRMADIKASLAGSDWQEHVDTGDEGALAKFNPL